MNAQRSWAINIAFKLPWGAMWPPHVGCVGIVTGPVGLVSLLDIRIRRGLILLHQTDAVLNRVSVIDNLDITVLESVQTINS